MPDEKEIIVPLHQEELVVGKRPVERARVRITTKVHERQVPVEQILDSREVDVERVPIGKPVDTIPPPRQEGDVLIIPLVEEELVITKRLVLREELRIRQRVERQVHRTTVSLRGEEAVVERQDISDANSPSEQGASE